MKKKNSLKLMIVGLLTVFGGLSVGEVANAEASPISVNPILPENQFNKEVSYYHLMMEPGEKQEIELQIFNSSDEERVALVTLTAATTNDNGLIDYNLPDKKVDKSLLYGFPTIASTPKEVKVPANKDVKTKISIKMPAESYDGMILGGINVKAKKKVAKDQDKQSSGMKIENEMNYAIGVVLVENEAPVKTNMELLKVSASQIMGNNTTKATLQNPTSVVMENVTIEAKIYKADNETVLYETKKENYRMAPNSSFDFGIPIGNERYKAGDYRLKLVATSDPKSAKDGEKQTWEFDEKFTIKRAEADKLNESAVDLPTDYTLYYIGGAVIALLVIGGIILLISLRRKKQAQIAAEKQARRRKKVRK